MVYPNERLKATRGEASLIDNTYVGFVLPCERRMLVPTRQFFKAWLADIAPATMTRSRKNHAATALELRWLGQMLDCTSLISLLSSPSRSLLFPFETLGSWRKRRPHTTAESRRRVHLSTVQPHRARPKAGEAGSGNTLQSGRSGDNSRCPGDQVWRLLGGCLGPTSSALGPAL